MSVVSSPKELRCVVYPLVQFATLPRHCTHSGFYWFSSPSLTNDDQLGTILQLVDPRTGEQCQIPLVGHSTLSKLGVVLHSTKRPLLAETSWGGQCVRVVDQSDHDRFFPLVDFYPSLREGQVYLEDNVVRNLIHPSTGSRYRVFLDLPLTFTARLGPVHLPADSATSKHTLKQEVHVIVGSRELQRINVISLSALLELAVTSCVDEEEIPVARIPIGRHLFKPAKEVLDCKPAPAIPALELNPHSRKWSVSFFLDELGVYGKVDLQPPANKFERKPELVQRDGEFVIEWSPLVRLSGEPVVQTFLEDLFEEAANEAFKHRGVNWPKIAQHGDQLIVRFPFVYTGGTEPRKEVFILELGELEEWERCFLWRTEDQEWAVVIGDTGYGRCQALLLEKLIPCDRALERHTPQLREVHDQYYEVVLFNHLTNRLYSVPFFVAKHELIPELQRVQEHPRRGGRYEIVIQDSTGPVLRSRSVFCDSLLPNAYRVVRFQALALVGSRDILVDVSVNCNRPFSDPTSVCLSVATGESETVLLQLASDHLKETDCFPTPPLLEPPTFQALLPLPGSILQIAPVTITVEVDFRIGAEKGVILVKPVRPSEFCQYLLGYVTESGLAERIIVDAEEDEAAFYFSDVTSTASFDWSDLDEVSEAESTTSAGGARRQLNF